MNGQNCPIVYAVLRLLCALKAQHAQFYFIFMYCTRTCACRCGGGGEGIRLWLVERCVCLYIYIQKTP